MQSCLHIAAPGDTLLLIEDGIYNVRTLNSLAARMNVTLEGIQVCVLRDDLIARGLSAVDLADHITTVDHAGFVELTCQHRQSVHWF
ncbi:MAG: tRNA 2-thiouridine synthesizing protein [Pseudomonadota bacterium]